MIEQRNISLVTLLKLFKRKVCYDHLLSKEEIKGFGVNALDNLDVKIKMDGVIVAVAHDEFKKMGLEDIGKFMNAKPIIVDVRGMFDEGEGKRKGVIISVYMMI
jgi:UDP-N-acetyl-D-mannosaminuronate dehydrogenase